MASVDGVQAHVEDGPGKPILREKPVKKIRELRVPETLVVRAARGRELLAAEVGAQLHGQLTTEPRQEPRRQP